MSSNVCTGSRMQATPNRVDLGLRTNCVKIVNQINRADQTLFPSRAVAHFGQVSRLQLPGHKQRLASASRNVVVSARKKTMKYVSTPPPPPPGHIDMNIVFQAATAYCALLYASVSLIPRPDRRTLRNSAALLPLKFCFIIWSSIDNH